MPFLYSLDLVARRYNVFPASIDLRNPEHMAWYRRACIFMSMESDRDAAIAKQHAQQR